jgi:hypothetical protein
MASGTIESIHNKILDKLTNIKNIYTTISDINETYKSNTLEKSSYMVNLLLDDIDQLEIKYKLSTINIISKYYNITNTQQQKVPTITDTNDDIQNIINEIANIEPAKLDKTHIRKIKSVQMTKDGPIIEYYYENINNHTVIDNNEIPLENIDTNDPILENVSLENSPIKNTPLENNDNGEIKLDEAAITEKYYQIVVSDNYIQKIDDYAIKAQSIVDELIRIYKKSSQNVISIIDKKRFIDIDRMIQRTKSIQIVIDFHKNNYEVCGKCYKKMSFMSNDYLLRCNNCGKIKNAQELSIEEHQNIQDSQKGKPGSYDAMRHFYFWLERIQAKENVTIDEESNKKIDNVINRDRIKQYELNCERMRKILKEQKLTKYNDNIPTLIKIKTGKTPPQLSYAETRIFSIKFSKIIEIYDLIKSDNERNSRYYPYFILKIAEDEFKDCPEKIKIREYIHLQSEETLIKHDQLYKEICAKAVELGEQGFIYKPTERYHF